MNYLYAFIGGGLGAVLRLILSTIIKENSTSALPFGTITVNIIGSFAIGVLFHVFQNTLIPKELRTLLIVGFLGGFTTFSSFSLESMNLLRDGQLREFLLNVSVSLVFCFGATFLGLRAGKLMTKVLA